MRLLELVTSGQLLSRQLMVHVYRPESGALLCPLLQVIRVFLADGRCQGMENPVEIIAGFGSLPTSLMRPDV
jgi:hypothetical protein